MSLPSSPPAAGHAPERPRLGARLGGAVRTAVAAAVTTADTAVVVLVAFLAVTLHPSDQLVAFAAWAALVLLLTLPVLRLLAGTGAGPDSPPATDAGPALALGVIVSFSSGLAVVAGPLTVAVALGSANPVGTSAALGVAALAALAAIALVLAWRSERRRLRDAAWGMIMAIAGLGSVWLPPAAWPWVVGAASGALIAASVGLWGGLDARLGRPRARGAVLLLTRGAGMAVGFCCGIGPAWFPRTVLGARIELGEIAITAVVVSIVGTHLVAALLQRADRRALRRGSPHPVLDLIRACDEPAAVADAVAHTLLTLTDADRENRPARVIVPLDAAFTTVPDTDDTAPPPLDALLHVLWKELPQRPGVRAIQHLFVAPGDELFVAVRLARGATTTALQEATAWAADLLRGVVDPATSRPVLRVVLAADLALSWAPGQLAAVVSTEPPIVNLALDEADLQARLTALAGTLRLLWTTELETLAVVAASKSAYGGNGTVASSTLRAVAADATEDAAALTQAPGWLQTDEETLIVLVTDSADTAKLDARVEPFRQFPVDSVVAVWHFTRAGWSRPRD